MVQIVTDTTSCLSPEMGKQNGIAVVPQWVVFPETSYREYLELSPSAFVERVLASPDVPSSKPAAVGDFAAAMRPAVEANEDIIYIAPSSKVSKTTELVAQAIQMLPGAKVRIIDTQLIGPLNGSMALLAAHFAAEGQSVQEIERHLRFMCPRGRMYCMIDSLDFLARGGRIGGAAALVGKLLQLKPIVTFRNGEVDQEEIVRTQRHALVRLQSMAIASAEQDWELHLAVMHAGVPEQAASLAHDLAWKLSLNKVPVYEIAPTVACHTGPAAIGVSFFVEEI